MKPGRRFISNVLLAIPAILMVGASAWMLVITRDIGNRAFYIAQGVLLLSLLLLWIFHARVVRPIRLLAGGIDLLREQDFSSRLRLVGQPEADRIAAMFNHMMATLKQERLHVREQNHFLDLLVEASPMGIVALDNTSRISLINRAAADFLGIGEKAAKGMRLADIASPLAQFMGSLPAGTSDTVRLNNAMVYRCTSRSYMDCGYAHPFILIEKLTEEIARAERTAYEKVIRMMAHEVNNSIGSVNSILDTAAFCIDDSEISEALTACRKRCTSMSEFITSFANVVKIPQAVPRSTDLNEFMEGTLTVLDTMCSARGIELRFEPAAGALPVRIDTVLMEQVLINLVKNACESIGDHGTVTLRTHQSPCGFTVEDNGHGIDAATQEKLFTPFFSSKSSGRGLGLLLVSDILNKHRCRFSLTTAPDGLTRFSVSFP